MDDTTTNGFVAGSIVSLLVGGVITGLIASTISEKRNTRKAKVLDAKYGPQIRDNLRNLEGALVAGNKDAARSLVSQRSQLLKEIDTLCSAYVYATYNGCGGYASAEVQANVLQGYVLEQRVEAATAVPPGDCCIP